MHNYQHGDDAEFGNTYEKFKVESVILSNYLVTKIDWNTNNDVKNSNLCI